MQRNMFTSNPNFSLRQGKYDHTNVINLNCRNNDITNRMNPHFPSISGEDIRNNSNVGNVGVTNLENSNVPGGTTTLVHSARNTVSTHQVISHLQNQNIGGTNHGVTRTSPGNLPLNYGNEDSLSNVYSTMENPDSPSHMDTDVSIPARVVIEDETDGDEPGTLPVNDDLLSRFSQPHMVNSPPRYPRFEGADVRKRTFASWTNAFPDVQQLIDSGFFFLGGRDSVQCFQCGIILHSWEAADTPDGEHSMHNPNCPFIVRKLRASSNQSHSARTSPVNEQANGHDDEARIRERLAQIELIKTKIIRLGHPACKVEEAFKRLSISGEINITRTKLLDAVYSLEEDEDFAAQMREARHMVESDDGETDEIEQTQQDEATAVSVETDRVVPTQDNSVSPPQSPHAVVARDQLSQAAADRLRELEQENESLRQRTLCRVCDDRPATELFLPCGHLACCDQCTDKLELCPFCRKKIERIYHVYLP